MTDFEEHSADQVREFLLKPRWLSHGKRKFCVEKNGPQVARVILMVAKPGHQGAHRGRTKEPKAEDAKALSPLLPRQFHHLFPQGAEAGLHEGLDIFEPIAEEAAPLASSTKRSTITFREIQTSVPLLLPREIGKHATS
ncbi:uncharacterized protein LOC130706316 [Balaenoptera acutorostrata]|uniref:Uncharacterized protein LOC130706316 n=1 Tax=Balaenoptera acutorostrata TaxID=9767 RepID=A0ABM3SV24_BALAC|nr:uncharacterized protein LOC130706316 [Balaenoptera acutorostrata]